MMLHDLPNDMKEDTEAQNLYDDELDVKKDMCDIDQRACLLQC